MQRPEQDVGEDEVERCPRANALSGDAVRFRDFDEFAGPVELGIGAGDADRFGVDVRRQHALPQRAGGRNGKHAAAGAEIENA